MIHFRAGTVGALRISRERLAQRSGTAQRPGPTQSRRGSLPTSGQTWSNERLSGRPRMTGVGGRWRSSGTPYLTAWRSSGAPYLTAWANSGRSGRERALRLTAIRQGRLEPLALSVSGRERMSLDQDGTLVDFSSDDQPVGCGSGALGSGGGRRSFRVSGLVWAALLSSRLRSAGGASHGSVPGPAGLPAGG